MITVDEALDYVLAETTEADNHKVKLEEAMGYSLAQPVTSDRDYPPFNRSAMDGYAIHQDGYSPQKEYRVVGRILAGEFYKDTLQPGQALKVMTGCPTPEGANCVIKIEDARELDDHAVRFEAAQTKVWQNIARQGEDLAEGSGVFARGHRIQETDIMTLSSLGRYELSVKKPPSIAIISTGDEIIEIDQKPEFFQIRNSNYYTLKALLSSYNISDIKKLHAHDNAESLDQTLNLAFEFDITILTGGVSMGDADFVPQVLERRSVKKVFHKVAIRPGKPIWFGRRPNGFPVFGLPGNPMSVQVGFKIFIEPLIRQYLEMPMIKPLQLPLSVEKKKRHQFREFFPVKFDLDCMSRTAIIPVKTNGSGDIRGSAFSDGLAIQPEDQDRIEAKTNISFIPWVSSK